MSFKLAESADSVLFSTQIVGTTACSRLSEAGGGGGLGGGGGAPIIIR